MKHIINELFYYGFWMVIGAVIYGLLLLVCYFINSLLEDYNDDIK